MILTNQRGLGKSRNLALKNIKSDIDYKLEVERKKILEYLSEALYYKIMKYKNNIFIVIIYNNKELK